ncbi:MAG: cysteine--tRNA ligase [Spirochaetales bacterium]|nr:MAG: cysteine--tRNA ligase [Spirochaetales bacterium]
MTLNVYNTLTRRLEEFFPITPPKVGLYCCGPTVYNFAHIGNLRTYIFEDILRRTLEYLNYKVTHVMNITDVGHLTDDADEGEDKITRSARERKMSVWEITESFSAAFFRDLEELHILMPGIRCKATDHIGDMIALILRLEEKGLTYTSGGNIYFDIGKLPGYGVLALLDRQELKAGARIEVDQGKKNPHDFVLWFTRSKFDHQAMQWDSPWGKGYPGWHIECSAMSMKYLGEEFDIHCGGIDHIPVHHTNEIAQSEGATGHNWVRYWVHGEFLVMDKEKMAKSAGNFITLEKIKQQGFEPLDYRYFCLGAHYRTQLQFSFESLEAAKNARANLMEKAAAIKMEARGELSPLGTKAKKYLEEFRTHLCTDLNMPRVLSVLWNAVKDTAITVREKWTLITEIDRIMGLKLSEVPVEEPELPPELKQLLADREKARKEKNYEKADEIRKQLAEKGFSLEDTSGGPKIRRIV